MGTAKLDKYLIRAINLCIEAGASVSVGWDHDWVSFRADLSNLFHDRASLTKLESDLLALEVERTGSKVIYKCLQERYIPVLGELEAEPEHLHPRAKIARLQREVREAIERYEKETGKPWQSR